MEILRVVDGPAAGTHIVIGDTLRVGRASVDLDLADPSVSRAHFELHRRDGQIVLRDLGSASGTWCDGRQLEGEVVVAPGAVIAAGGSRLVLLEAVPSASSVGRGSTEVRGPEGGAWGLRPGEVLRIGRDGSNDVVLDDSSVSRRHCELRTEGANLYVEDLGSTAGTLVNGVRLLGTQRLDRGDVVTVGTIDFTVTRTPASTAEGDGLRWLSVRLEDTPRSWAVEVEAGSDVTVAQVLPSLIAFVGGDPDDASGWFAYERDRGEVLDETRPWSEAAPERGATLLLARGRVDLAGIRPRRLAPRSHRVTVNQAPRAGWSLVEAQPVVPSVPETTSWRGRGVFWQALAGGAGIVGGLTLVVLRPSSSFRMMGIVFAIVGFVTISSAVFGEQSRRRFRRDAFRKRIQALEVELARVRERQRVELLEVFPAATDALHWPRNSPDRRLWQRRRADDDFLCLRIGLGERPAAIRMDDAWRRSDSPFAPELGAVLDRHRTLSKAPITTQGLVTPVIGIWGDAPDTTALARSLVLQVALLHSPHDVRMAVLSSDRSWSWLRWLPHLESERGIDLTFTEEGSEFVARSIADELTAAASRGGAPLDHAWFVLMTEENARLPSGRELLAAASRGGAVVLVVASRRDGVPSEAVLEVECRGGQGHLRGDSTRAADDVDLDAVEIDVAAATVQRLGRLHDPRYRAPRTAATVDLLELLGHGSLEEIDPLVAWATPPSPLLTAPVGQGVDGRVVTVGLRRDGPHGLIAGTTGSGKSVLLQTLLTSLALTHPPDRLNLFLVDFKGGATFKESGLAQLPHTVGLVTDLEGNKAVTARAFRSIKSEITRRKRLTDSARVENIVQYERLPTAGREPMPNLVVVIDEFALLVKEQPEVRDELGVVATQGRSLGVHLLLAMQSPEGVVSPDIKKNTNIWICLRVVQADESIAVLDRPDAALLPHDEPGRGFLRIGAARDLVEFRAARVRDGDTERSGIVVRPFGDVAPADASDVDVDVLIDPVEATRRLCEAIADAGERSRLAEQRRLWLPPLPRRLDAASLSDDDQPPSSHVAVRLGLADHPDSQEQRTAWIDLDEAANVLVLGEFGAGKSTTLQHIALDLAERHPPTRLHVYGVDAGSGSLAALGALPHVGAVVSVDDAERLVRLFERLVADVASRKSQVANAGTSWASRRAASPDEHPTAVVLVDDLAVFREHAEEIRAGRLLEQLQSLAQTGPSVGVHLVVAANQRSDMRMSLQNLFGAKVALRMADPTDYDVVGLRSLAARDHDPPQGRALLSGPIELQVPWVDDERARAVVARWPVADGDASKLPRPVESLPNEVALDDVLARLSPSPGQVPIGVGGPDALAPIVLDADRMGPHLVVLGEDLTGRSTALQTYASSVTATDPAARLAVIALRRSPLRSLSSHPRTIAVAVDEDGALELIEHLLTDGRDVHLLVDDAEGLGQRVGSAIEPLLRAGRDLGLRSVVAARTADFTRIFDGWARYLLSLKIGLLLMPTVESTTALDIRFPAPTVAFRPGRGYLVNRGDVVLVQVATTT